MFRSLDQPVDVAPPTWSGGSATDVENSPRKPIVVVVEDDQSLRKLLRFYLGREYGGTDVSDGDRLLASLAHAPADLVVLDVHLPGASGLDLIATIRTTTPEQQRPMFLLISGMNACEFGDDFAKTGADDFLAKPFSRTQFVARVRALLARKLTRPT